MISTFILLISIISGMSNIFMNKDIQAYNDA
jgi:hypothetical protein